MDKKLNFKIAVTSRSFSRNPELRAQLLSKYRDVTFNDDGLALEGATLIKFLVGHDKAITALETIDDEVLSNLPDLKVISKYGVGCDMIDMEALKRHKIRFGWTGGVNRRSVSELVISFAISLLRYVPIAHAEVMSGIWRQHVGGCLSGRTFGVIGCGFVGQDLIRLLQPFGCKILVNDVREFSDFYRQFNVEAVSIDELLVRADIVSLHVPLDFSTKNLLSADRLALMKSEAILINTARGGIVDEQALKKQLESRGIAGAAFDVLDVEPPVDFELLKLKNFLVTPHIGGSAREAILAMGEAAIDGLEINKLVIGEVI